MTSRLHFPSRLLRLAAWLAGLALGCLPAYACTIAILTDGEHVLYCNNEDSLNPRTRIWFVPGGEGHHGCVYLGHDDGATQGGFNERGLAFDFISGVAEEWKHDPKRKDLPPARSPSLMLETCATVEEAIAFYEVHNEPAFSRATIFVADRTGASAIIGARNGALHVVRATECHASGANGAIANRMLASDRTPTLANATQILRAAMQRHFFGVFGTQYSNVFDLKSGDIFIYQFPLGDDPVKLNLAEELKKGAHLIENRTPRTPYVFVAALTTVPSLAFMLLATRLRQRRKLVPAATGLAIVWALAIGALFYFIGQGGRANSLTIVPVYLAPLVVIVCVGWFVRLRKLPTEPSTAHP